jgi:hypothetical protein
MKEIKRVDLKILAKVGFLVGMGMTLIWLGVVVPLITLVFFRLTDMQMFLTFWVNMVLMAVVCGVLMMLHFLIVGWVYNLVAKKTGGIKLEIK